MKRSDVARCSLLWMDLGQYSLCVETTLLSISSVSHTLTLAPGASGVKGELREASAHVHAHAREP